MFKPVNDYIIVECIEKKNNKKIILTNCDNEKEKNIGRVVAYSTVNATNNVWQCLKYDAKVVFSEFMAVPITIDDTSYYALKTENIIAFLG